MQCHQRKACDADSGFAQLAGLSRQGDEAAIVQGMLTHSEHAGVQQQACSSLRSFTHNHFKRSKISFADDIEAVVAAVEAHKKTVLVQQPACWSLSNLAVNAGKKVKIEEVGDIYTVLIGAL